MTKQIRQPGTYLYPLPVVLISCGVGEEANIFIGEVVAAYVDDSVLDEQGRVDFARLSPFLYTGRNYHSVGRTLVRSEFLSSRIGKSREQ